MNKFIGVVFLTFCNITLLSGQIHKDGVFELFELKGKVKMVKQKIYAFVEADTLVLDDYLNLKVEGSNYYHFDELGKITRDYKLKKNIIKNESAYFYNEKGDLKEKSNTTFRKRIKPISEIPDVSPLENKNDEIVEDEAPHIGYEKRIEYIYDKANQVIFRKVKNKIINSFNQYDEKGNLIRTANLIGKDSSFFMKRYYTYKYDDFGNLLMKSYYVNGVGQDYHSYKYEKLNDIILNRDYSEGKLMSKVENVYDEKQRIIEKKSFNNEKLSSIIQYKYLPAGISEEILTYVDSGYKSLIQKTQVVDEQGNVIRKYEWHSKSNKLNIIDFEIKYY